MDIKNILKQKRLKNKSLFHKVVYELLEVKGINRPAVYFGIKNYRKLRVNLQFSYENMHLSTIRWLAEQLDVTPRFIVNVIKRSNKGKEGLNIEQFNRPD